MAPPIVFTHVPKAAGASFAEAVHGLVGSGAIHTLTRDDDDISSLLSRGDVPAFVCGHIRFPIAFALYGPTLYFGALRDPIDRIASNYFFVIRENGIPPSMYADGLSQGFDRFYETVIREAGRINLQCRFFSDAATAAAAIEAIRTHYCLVWDSERLETAWPLAAQLVLNHGGDASGTVDTRRLGSIPPLTGKGHAAPVSSDPGGSRQGERPKSYRDFLGKERVAAIAAENAEDAALYDWLCGEGGVFVNSGKVAVV